MSFINKLQSFVSKVHRVVMVRHGESEWNANKTYCGWFDSGLTKKGKREAKRAGSIMNSCGYDFDIAFTSLLGRAEDTLQTILDEINQPYLPVERSWRLNERHYGALTGLKKREVAEKYGSIYSDIWTKCFYIPPPPIERNNPYYESIIKDPRYSSNGLKLSEIPTHESLKDTTERTLPYWHEHIVPQILNDKNVLIVAHLNSLRCLIKYIGNLTTEQVMKLHLPNGIPMVFFLDNYLNEVSSYLISAKKQARRLQKLDSKYLFKTQ